MKPPVHTGRRRGGRGSGTEETAGDPEQVLRELDQRGVRRVVYTSVERDGMLAGPDLDEVRRVCDAFGGEVVYSGGVGSLDDLRGLGGLGLSNLVGEAAFKQRRGDGPRKARDLAGIVGRPRPNESDDLRHITPPGVRTARRA